MRTVWKICWGWWNRRSGWQKTAITSVLTFLIGTPATLLYRAFLEDRFSWSLADQIVAAISEFLLSGFVIGAVVTAALFGFGPSIFAAIRNLFSRVYSVTRWQFARASKKQHLYDLAKRALKTAHESRDLLEQYNKKRREIDKEYWPRTGTEEEKTRQFWDESFRQQDVFYSVMDDYKRTLLPEVNYLLNEFDRLGYVDEIPRTTKHPVNQFCIEEGAACLDEAARRALADLEARGFVGSAASQVE